MAYRRRCWTRPLERWSRPDLAPAERLTPTPTIGELRDLAAPPGNRLEALSGKRKGQHSVRACIECDACAHQRDRAWTARHQRRHRVEAGSLLQHVAPLLAELASQLRRAMRRRRGGPSDRKDQALGRRGRAGGVCISGFARLPQHRRSRRRALVKGMHHAPWIVIAAKAAIQ